MSGDQTPRVSFLDSNGLEAGNIPAGKPCPFRVGCLARTSACPDNANLRSVPYSCAAARLHSLIKNDPEVQGG